MVEELTLEAPLLPKPGDGRRAAAAGRRRRRRRAGAQFAMHFRDRRRRVDAQRQRHARRGDRGRRAVRAHRRLAARGRRGRRHRLDRRAHGRDLAARVRPGLPRPRGRLAPRRGDLHRGRARGRRRRRPPRPAPGAAGHGHARRLRADLGRHRARAGPGQAAVPLGGRALLRHRRLAAADRLGAGRPGHDPRGRRHRGRPPGARRSRPSGCARSSSTGCARGHAGALHRVAWSEIEAAGRSRPSPRRCGGRAATTCAPSPPRRSRSCSRGWPRSAPAGS